MPKKEVIAIPKDKKEMEQFLAQIIEEQHAADNIELKLKVKVAPLETKISKLEAQLAEMQAEEMAKVEPYQEKISQLVEGISTYVKANRDELTENLKLKTVELLTGILQWSKTPPAVKIADEELTLKSLKSLKLKRFIRTIEEPDKQAMKKELDIAKTVEGVLFIQKEKFIIIPTGLEEIIGYIEELEV